MAEGLNHLQRCVPFSLPVLYTIQQQPRGWERTRIEQLWGWPAGDSQVQARLMARIGLFRRSQRPIQ
jgi:hypothetical protein